MEIKIIVVVVALGVLAFSLNTLFDWISIKRNTKAKPFVTITFFGLQGLALFLSIWTSVRFSLPVGLSILGWLLLPISIVLLSYSLTIGISLGKNYSRSGVSNHLVKTGNYALIRHPDLIWYVTFLIALILVSSSATLLIVAPIWAAWKLICVIIQDKVLFVRMIPGYRQYKQETPMIIPNRKSLIAFWRTIKIDIHRSEKIVV